MFFSIVGCVACTAALFYILDKIEGVKDEQ